MRAKLTISLRAVSSFSNARAPRPAPFRPFVSPFTTSLDPRVSRMGVDPVFSAGEDPVQLQESLDPLIAPDSGKWTLTRDGQGIERSLKFKTFKAAWQFMCTVADECKSHRHHPEWSNVYNSVFVRWTTHTPEGLSSKDVNMAKICDEVATRDESRALGEEGAGGDETLRNVADEVAKNAADCCKR